MEWYTSRSRAIEGVASKSVSTLTLIKVRARNEKKWTTLSLAIRTREPHSHMTALFFLLFLSIIFLCIYSKEPTRDKDKKKRRATYKKINAEHTECEHVCIVQCACMATTSMMATAPSYQWGFFNQRFPFLPYFSSFLFIFHFVFLTQWLKERNAAHGVARPFLLAVLLCNVFIKFVRTMVP